jgi:hypothetical protein
MPEPKRGRVRALDLLSGPSDTSMDRLSERCIPLGTRLLKDVQNVLNKALEVDLRSSAQGLGAHERSPIPGGTPDAFQVAWRATPHGCTAVAVVRGGNRLAQRFKHEEVAKRHLVVVARSFLLQQV